MNDIRDIKGPVDLGGFFAWGMILAALGVVVLGSLAVWRWRRWRDDPRRRALAQARHAVRRLEGEAAGLDDRNLYARLIGIVRQLLGVRLGRSAAALTREEMLPLLAALPGIGQPAWAGLLARAEAARYAGAVLSGGERQGDLETVRRLAGSTRPC